MTRRPVPESLPQHRYPADTWRFVEHGFGRGDQALNETRFAIGNGYLGLRGDHDEGRGGHDPGTYINGFHETWSIHHAEDAFGFATIGQTIVNVPDPKALSLYVDDEPFDLELADLDHYERVLDLRAGTVTRDVTWRTPSGKLVRIRSERLVSLVHRHIAAIRYEVTMERGSAPVLVSSRLFNRQDADFHVASTGLPDDGDIIVERDPRRHRSFNHRVLHPRWSSADERQLTLGFECTNSRMAIAGSVRHEIEFDASIDLSARADDNDAQTDIAVQIHEGQTLRIVKYIAFHTSHYVPLATGIEHTHRDDAGELVTRCNRSLDRAERDGFDVLLEQQREWLDDFWERSDVELFRAGDNHPSRNDEPTLRGLADQQAVRWNLFQLAQASAQHGEQGIAAKGVTGGGYEGHYFWDTEMYVVPFLAYTQPVAARQLLRFRWRMLSIARERARALNQDGALYPWRTINGEEASAYYAAGTAQYHINAAIAFALKRYVDASGDMQFLAGDGAEVLCETARLWNDLGFYSARPIPANGLVNGNGESNGHRFHIHGVTGPDEYTAVVNDNLYTNVMARFNLRWAARVLELLEAEAPAEYTALCRVLDLGPDEREEWTLAAESMFLPYDATLGIHPQDSDFFEREQWDFDKTPPDKYPLLLHYHPLVIYRHQVLKQADVVLAMALRSDQFSLDVRRRNFDYYDPLTTGDSSLSACVQAMAAAQIEYSDLAVRYFREALYIDLADLHHNTRDGVHVASTGGVWGAVVFGFAGLLETGSGLSFDPALPDEWSAVSFRIQRHGSRMRVDLNQDGCTVHVLSGDPVPVHTVAGYSPDQMSPELADLADLAVGAEASPPADEVVNVAAGESFVVRRDRLESVTG